eukprot:11964.XXX_384985_385119_1 [CDS] Oithona nana genome sequencing.
MGKGRAFYRQSNLLLNAKNSSKSHATFAASVTSSIALPKDFFAF